MASDVHIKVSGLSTFARECRRIGKEAQAELRKTNLRAAELVVPEAIRRAPKGKHEGGGTVIPVSASIRAVGGQRFAAVRAGSARSPHAAPIEFGGTLARRGFKGLSRTEQKFGVRFSPAGERLRGRHKRVEGEARRAASVTHITARPYVFPAVEAMQTLVREQYMRDFVKLVSQAFPF
jgi:hypothetical protein